MSDSQIKTSDLDRGVTRVHLVGEVDIATAEPLQRALDDLIRDGQTRLLVDLTDVSFIDSTGLGVLLHTVKQLRRRRGRLVVLCPDPTMRALFELVGHNLLFPVDETLERALTHLRPRRSRFDGPASRRGMQTGPRS
jgi:anti-sigma B factor antagonist